MRSVFRPPDAVYEAEDITVEGNRFVGGNAAVVWSAARGGVVRGNTIYQPRQWICRIMQEGPEGLEPCSEGVFERNLVVYDGRGLRELIQKRLAPIGRHSFSRKRMVRPRRRTLPALPSSGAVVRTLSRRPAGTGDRRRLRRGPTIDRSGRPGDAHQEFELDRPLS
ncbi:MAG: hypothetical protein R2748_22695 [Bryobacterales bacterium]